jgi:hypothetical protein
VVLVIITALATYLLTSGQEPDSGVTSPPRADRTALTDPLDNLSQTSAAVTAFLVFGSMENDDAVVAPPTTLVPTTTTTEPTEPGALVQGNELPESNSARIEVESGKVDFANHAAVMGAPGRPVPPVVVVDNTTYVDWTSPMPDVSTGTSGWVQMPPEVGAHTAAGTAAFLMTVVDHAEDWVDPDSVRVTGDLIEATLDDERVRADIDATLDAMDDPTADQARRELASGTRAVPTGRLQVRVGQDDLPVEIRIELATTGQLATMTWKLSDFGTKVDARTPPADERISYKEFTDAYNQLIDTTGPPSTIPPDQLVDLAPSTTLAPGIVPTDPRAPASPNDVASSPPGG